MKKIIGDINIFTQCIGLKEGRKEILDSMVLFNLDFNLTESSFSESVYYSFLNHGVEYLFEEKILKCIFFFLEQEGDYTAYSGIEQLIQGINSNSTKSDIYNFFDYPSESSETWIKFFIEDDKYLHFEFRKNHIKTITIGIV